MALVIVEVVSEVHPRGNAMLQPVRRPSPKYWERLFYSITK